MEPDVIMETAVSLAGLGREALEHSVLVSLVFLLLKIYSAVLIVDFVLIMINRDIVGDLRKMHVGAVRPTMSRTDAAKRWDAIRSRLDSGNPSHYKVAVLEADAFAERLVGQMGYEGRNLKERLDAVPEGAITSAPGLREAHELRNRIILENDFEPSLKEAGEALGKFKRLLDELRLS